MDRDGLGESESNNRIGVNTPFPKSLTWLLGVIAFLLVMYTLFVAQDLFKPITMAFVLALLFRPFVRWCGCYRIPNPISAAFVVLVLLMCLLWGVTGLVGSARTWVMAASDHFQKAGQKLSIFRDQVNDFQEVSEKVEEMAEGESDSTEQKAAPFPFAENPPQTPYPFSRETADSFVTEDNLPAENSSSNTTNDEDQAIPSDTDSELTQDDEADGKPVEVEVKQPVTETGFKIIDSAGGVIASVIITLVMTYFLLASGDTLTRNFLKVLPTNFEKRNVIELVRNVERRVSSYLLAVTVINIGLGVAVGTAMWLLGVPNPILWGAMATIFNYVPFLGALVGVFVIFIVSVLTFDSLSYAVVPPLVYWGLTNLEGNVLTPYLLGRSMSLNPVLVFLSLIIWGWIWGITGAILAVPILAAMKVSFDQFERTRAIGTLLGHGKGS